MLVKGKDILVAELIGSIQKAESLKGYAFAELYWRQNGNVLSLVPGPFDPLHRHTLEALLVELRNTFRGVGFDSITLNWDGRDIQAHGFANLTITRGI